ncbi:iron-containing alcohol dehydrogenase [Methylobacterium nodulans]|uniref:Alcohol dehydrogenase 2 n=1 Tax=Methylobacterium nodulans (strain LMG 21967 / CNCM I-2342 / ORS 2060) TaxID=460265 RepID=B8IM64_METNO|nr:iron-containing alcohol dehydrogenase [Methylobacterium nodulans]ACL56408.1 iron-containing alcohol dehydrogenase [Methylobacterium nodulans ORS 2060]
MTPFTFQTCPNILFEPGATAKLPEIIGPLGARRILLVTDRGVRGAGLTAPAEAALQAAGLSVGIYDAVVADPPAAVIEAAAARARAEGTDLVLAIGGGSALDTAKLVAYLARSDEPLDALYGVGLAKGQRLPLVLVPTTAGTGSEVTPIAIVTTPTTEKKGVVSAALLPDWAVLDPDLTLGLPASVTAATGIDAMVHAIEAYTSRHKKNPMSDQFARQALTLLAGNIRTACREGSDRAARGAMLLGSMLAGMAFANAPVAAVHALAYPIGALFHVPHGLSNALVLMGVMRFNLPAAQALYAELAPILDPAAAGLPPAEAASRFVESLGAICRDCGVPDSLAAIGIGEADLPRLATDAMKQTRLLVNNPREVTYADAIAIYSEALTGRARPEPR